jgi:hypothetical protein
MIGLTALLPGCGDSGGPPRAALLSSDGRPELLATSATVLSGTVTFTSTRANLTFIENNFAPEPARPKNGWTAELTVAVDRVVKGDFPIPADLVIAVHVPSEGPAERRGPPAYGRRLLLGFPQGPPDRARTVKVLQED